MAPETVKTVYLCGPMTGVSYEKCADWRRYVKVKLDPGIVGISPLRSADFLEGETALKHTYPDHVFGRQKAITTQDRNDVMTCDILFANFLGAETVSVGSVMELAWADAFRKPIVLVMEPEGNIHEHPIVCEVSGFRVSSLDEGVHVANRILALR